MIEKNWQELIRPQKLEVTAGVDPHRKATIIAQPLERGFGLVAAGRGRDLDPDRRRRA